MQPDRSNIYFFRGVQSRDPETEKWVTDVVSFEDLIAIEEAFKSTKCKLAVFDPIQGFGGRSNMNYSHEVRRLLAPLADLAEEYGVAVFLIAHPRKSATDRALQRMSGSVDIGAAARSVLLVGDAPQKNGERAIVHIKSNLAKPGSSLGYLIEDDGKCGQFLWTGLSDLTAGDLLAPEQGPEQETALDEAVEFLDDILEKGPIPVSTLKAEARKAAIAWRTLERAKKKLGVVAIKAGGPGTSWCWSKESKGRQTSIYRGSGGLYPQNNAETLITTKFPKDRQGCRNGEPISPTGGLRNDDGWIKVDENF